MIKYSSINMNPNLIPKNIVNVPKLTENELREKFVYFYLKYKSYIHEIDKISEEHEGDISYANIHALTLIGELNGNSILKDVGLKEIFNDFHSGVCEYKDFPLEGFHTLDNGFTFFGYVGQGDETGSYFFIVYWDGKGLKGYVPKYGNTYIIDMNAFEGLYDYVEDDDAPYDKWYKSPEVQALTLDERKNINKYLEEDYGKGWNHLSDGFDDWNEEGLSIPETGTISFDVFSKLPKRIAYRIAHSYNHCSQEDYNWNAIKTDLMSKFKVY